MASDIIHYGANLIDWLERERGGLQCQVRPWPPIKEIRFWGQAVRYGEDESSIVRRQIVAAAAAIGAAAFMTPVSSAPVAPSSKGLALRLQHFHHHHKHRHQR